MQKGILITGGGHGIGKQICRDFLEAGAQVCFIDFDKEISQPFAAEYPNLFYFYGDVASPVALQEFVDFAMAKLGRIDVELSIIVQSKHARNFPSPYRIASPHRR